MGKRTSTTAPGLTRNHHALKRRAHHSRPKPIMTDFAQYAPDPRILTAAILDDISSAAAHTARGNTTACPACGRYIHRAHTAYHLTMADGTDFEVCYECGSAIADHMGITDLADADRPGPYAASRRIPAQSLNPAE